MMTPYQQREQERGRNYRRQKFATVAERVRSGATLKDLFDAGARLWTFKGLAKHAEEFPIEVAEIRAQSKANSDRKKKVVAARKIAAKTHCVQGHELSGDNVFIRTYRNGDKGRVCRTCARLAARVVRPMTPDQVMKVKQLVQRGVAIGRMFHGGPMHITCHQNMMHQRSIDPAFDRMMTEHASRGPERAMRARAEARRRQQASDYQTIRSMVPRWMAPEAGDDVAQSVIVSLLEGSIKRDQVAGRIRELVTILNRSEKFGSNRFLSLDVSPFGDGAPEVERVSQGLWS